MLLFLTFSVLVANSKTVANPARGLLNREKRTKEKRLAAYPPHPQQLDDASTAATQVSVGLASVQGFNRLVD